MDRPVRPPRIRACPPPLSGGKSRKNSGKIFFPRTRACARLFSGVEILEKFRKNFFCRVVVPFLEENSGKISGKKNSRKNPGRKTGIPGGMVDLWHGQGSSAAA